jgi:hypothetical protein
MGRTSILNRLGKLSPGYELKANLLTVDRYGYGGYNNGYGVNPYGQQGPYADPNARFIRPGNPYNRGYGCKSCSSFSPARVSCGSETVVLKSDPALSVLEDVSTSSCSF